MRMNCSEIVRMAAVLAGFTGIEAERSVSGNAGSLYRTFECQACFLMEMGGRSVNVEDEV